MTPTPLTTEASAALPAGTRSRGTPRRRQWSATDRQAHRREGRQARGHVHLDEDVRGLDAENSGRAHPGQHDASVGTPPRSVNDSNPIQAGGF